MNCRSVRAVSNVTRALNFTGLIPRLSYNIAIRADSQDLKFNAYTGLFSQPISADTAKPQG